MVSHLMRYCLEMPWQRRRIYYTDTAKCHKYDWSLMSSLGTSVHCACMAASNKTSAC